LIIISPKERQYYRIISEQPGISSNELMRFFSVSRGALYDRLSKLRMNGYLRESIINKQGLKGYWIDKRKKIG